MIAYKQIIAAVDEIARRFKPQRVILFGSYAYGEPNQDSDVDIMVVMKRAMTDDRKYATRASIERRFPMDLLVDSERRIRERIALNDFFLMDVTEKGIVLHDTADRGVGQKGRRRLRRRLADATIAKAGTV